MILNAHLILVTSKDYVGCGNMTRIAHHFTFEKLSWDTYGYTNT
jgi:hypothetical protein